MSSRHGTASTSAPLITLTAPVELPWSWRSTLPPLGQAISQASKSGVRATSRQARSLHVERPRPADGRHQAARHLAGIHSGRAPRRAARPGSGGRAPSGRGAHAARVRHKSTKSIVFSGLRSLLAGGAPTAGSWPIPAAARRHRRRHRRVRHGRRQPPRQSAPNGLPSAAEVTEALRALQLDVHGLSSTSRQEWGVAAFAGMDPEFIERLCTAYLPPTCRRSGAGQRWSGCAAATTSEHGLPGACTDHKLFHPLRSQPGRHCFAISRHSRVGRCNVQSDAGGLACMRVRWTRQRMARTSPRTG